MSDADAAYIWSDTHGKGRNRYVMFRRAFELGEAPAGGALHIFADTRYRLLVNGRVRGHGPARFFVRSPEYDTYQLGPELREGANVVAVLVNSYGCVSFHSEYSRGGLIAWGEVSDADGREVDLSTGPGWKALHCDARRADTAKLSFALNPGEMLDSRQLPADWAMPWFDDGHWAPAAELDDQEHWGELTPRSIPPLDEREAPAVSRLGAWRAALPEDEDVYSFVLPTPASPERQRSQPALAMTYIHSPRNQQTTLGAFWGRYWLNGARLTPRERDDVDLRQDFPVTLREGWNCLQVMENAYYGAWEFYLGLPREAELSLSAEKRLDAPNTFRLAGPWPGEIDELGDRIGLPLEAPEELPEQLGPWSEWPRGRGAESAYVERCRKTFEPVDEGGAVAVRGEDYAESVGEDTLSLLYDFGREMLGRPVLEFTAAPGTRVDLTYSEKLTGGLPADHGRHNVRMAERFIARGGEQVIHTFHPRGFRYLEVLVTGDLSRFRLDRLAVSRALYPTKDVGEFECSDDLLNRIWRLGRDTQRACMEDAYLDCPRRERGLYAGDTLVQFFTNLATFGDTDLMRRCIRLFWQGQDQRGFLRPGAHGLTPGRHPDYSAIIAQSLWLYYARTGDEEFLRRSKPNLERLMAALESLELQEGDLLGGSDMNPYLDRQRMDKGGVNCALNCFYQRAFHDAARVMRTIGDGAAAEHYASRAEALAGAIRRSFWDADQGAFLDRRKADVAEAGPSVAANTLPLLYGIAGEDQVAGPLDYLTEALRDNFCGPVPPTKDSQCSVMPYFSFYSAGVLFDHDRAPDALQFFRDCWGMMLEHGAWTCWETFTGGSACHAWSSCPTHYLSTRVLGVRFPDPGRPNRVRIAPQPAGLDWARGVYPHPAGPLRVAWRVEEGRLEVEWEAPDEVAVSAD